MNSKIKLKKFINLKEGIDFTLEGENIVFTKKYLEERGYCCGSGCRNCPYQGQQKEDALKLRK